MGKRHLFDSHEYEPCRKKLSLSESIEPGDVLTDLTGKQWKLGREVGQGAFGEIYVASDHITASKVNEQSSYVAKIEHHTNGPLFVEVNFYLRVAKEALLNDWKSRTRTIIGLPHYIASGSHIKQSTKYRFLILPRYSIDLQQVLEQHHNKFNIKTVLTIGLQLLDILEYIHSHGFIHADIKASNIMINCEKKQDIVDDNELIMYRFAHMQYMRFCKLSKATPIKHNLRSNKHHSLVSPKSRNKAMKQENPLRENRKVDTNQVYLLDYGLANKYRKSNGEHKEYCIDERRAHAGTILFCSLDAHDGVQSRRSDLESLGYNMVYWLTGTLPWVNNVEDYQRVRKQKQLCRAELDNFLHLCFGKYIPTCLRNFFKLVKKLEYDETPDYERCRKVFIQGFNEYGYKKVFTLDFDNKEGWGNKKLRIKNSENDRKRASVVCSIIRSPLKSNLPAKHILRKNIDKERMLRWSTILIDPELILKTAKKTKNKDYDEIDGADALENLDISELNPTEAMINVYNNYLERQNIDFGLSFRHNCSNGDWQNQHIEGYNATMMAVHTKMMEQREATFAQLLAKLPPKNKKKKHHSLPEAQPVAKRYNTRSTRRVT